MTNEFYVFSHLLANHSKFVQFKKWGEMLIKKKKPLCRNIF